MTLKRIVCVGGDPGGANALAPVIARLRREGNAVEAFAYLQAVSCWRDAGLRCSELPPDLLDSTISEIVSGANLLLAGTSVNRYEFEKRFICAASAQGIPSLALLDFWSNYSMRFSDASGNLAFLPDRIAVMDELARNEMIAEGIPPARIAITGHPALDSLSGIRTTFASEKRLRIRESLGVGEADWLVLFASQPPGFDESEPDPLPPWQDRRRIAANLSAALQQAGKIHGRKTRLLIRPHPRENSDIFDEMKQKSVIVEKNGDRHELILCADVVAGMNTMLLVEAAHLGRPTLSLRPHLPLPDPFPPNRSGLILPVYREEDLAPALESLLLGKAVEALPDSGEAAAKVAELIHSMIGEK